MTWSKLWNLLIQLGLSSYTPAFYHKNNMPCITAVLRRMKDIWSRLIAWCQVQPRTASPSQSICVKWMLIIICHWNVVVCYAAITDSYCLSSSVNQWLPRWPSPVEQPSDFDHEARTRMMDVDCSQPPLQPDLQRESCNCQYTFVSLPFTLHWKRKESSLL